MARQRKRLGTVVHGRGKHPNTLAALRKAAENRKKTRKRDHPLLRLAAENKGLADDGQALGNHVMLRFHQ